jgi:hypothetical protein
MISKPTPLGKRNLNAKTWVRNAMRMISEAKLKVVNFRSSRSLWRNSQFLEIAGEASIGVILSRLLKNSFSKTENKRCSYGQKHAIVNDNNMLSGGSDYAR